MSQTQELHPAANVAITLVGLPIMAALTMIPVSLASWFVLWLLGLVPATRQTFLVCWGASSAIAVTWLAVAGVWSVVSGKK